MSRRGSEVFCHNYRRQQVNTFFLEPINNGRQDNLEPAMYPTSCIVRDICQIFGKSGE